MTLFRHLGLISGWLLLLALSARPASGQPGRPADAYAPARAIIADLDSIVAPNGVQEAYQVPLGGVRQWVFVRGQDRRNPIILFVHGGPASPIAPVAWTFQRPLEEYFTIVSYDQRGAGKTYAANDTTGLGPSIRIERYVQDAIELAELVRRKYGPQKLILLGHSWGTIVGMRAALQRPDLFCAYVGMGQVINTRENERLSYEYGLQQAAAHQNEVALRELRAIGPYPGQQPITRERIIIARKWPQYYGGLSAYRSSSGYFFRAPLLSPHYTAADVAAIDQGSLFTLGRVLPEFLAVDFTAVRTFPIPVFMLLGRHDYTTPTAPVVAWLAQVKAPAKKAVWFENSAHLLPLEEPGKLLVTLLQEVHPLAPKAAGKPPR